MLTILFVFLWERVILNGIIAHYIAEVIVRFIKRHMAKTPRKAAMIYHYTERAFRRGHASPSVLACTDSDCRSVFA